MSDKVTQLRKYREFETASQRIKPAVLPNVPDNGT